LYSRRFKTVANRLKSEHVHGNCPISITKSDATRRDVTKQFCRVGSGHQSSNIRIMRIIFLESYARILTYETLSYVNHNIVAKQARRNVFVSGGGVQICTNLLFPFLPFSFPLLLSSLALPASYPSPIIPLAVQEYSNSSFKHCRCSVSKQKHITLHICRPV